MAFTPSGRRLLVGVDRFHYEFLDPKGDLLGEIDLPFTPSGFSPSSESLIGTGRPAADPGASTVYVARTDGTGVRALTVVKDALLSVSWSSRGEIAVGVVPYIDGTPTPGVIELINDRGRILRTFRPPSTRCRWTEPSDLDWSPDGRRLVFGAAATGCPAGVFMLDVRTAHAWRLNLKLPTEGAMKRAPRYVGSGQPFFSPSGHWLLIYTGGSGLFRARTDGSHPVLLIDDSSVPPRSGYAGVLGTPAWQPVPKRKRNTLRSRTKPT